MLPPYLPTFALDALVLPETGKQDKIELRIGKWTAYASNQEDVHGIYSRLGPPPPIYDQHGRRTRLRQNHGNAYGWIFNSIDTREWFWKRTVNIRKLPLDIEGEQAESPSVLPPPLFKGSCEWRTAPGEGEQIFLTGTLDLILNPTRFVRHQSVLNNTPSGFQKRNETRLPPFQEWPLKPGDDNWFPLWGRLYSRLGPEQWRNHLHRYLRGVEDAFQVELERVCAAFTIPHERTERSYSVKSVESYWEWLSPDPLKIVEDLIPHARTFSSRFRGERVYNVDADNGESGDVRILRIEHAPGEWLKIYAKTNRRIRFEVIHTLTGANRFQFPRELDAQGTVRRLSGHTFNSQAGVHRLFDRLRTRAATVVNAFLQHVAHQAQIVPSHISAYNALLNVVRAMPNDFPSAVTLTSLLIHSGGITPGGDDAKIQAIDALRALGVIEPSLNRKRYVPTAAYRHAFQMLRAHANFPILTARVRRRNPPANG